MNNPPLNPSDFQVLELVSLEPRIAFSKPKDYFLDVFKLSPVDDLEVSAAVAEKLQNSGFWYLSELLELCEAEVKKRANLEDKEVAQIRAALSLRKLSFHPCSTLTKREQISSARMRHEEEIRRLREALALGYPEAGVYLGRLAEIGVIDDEPEGLYRFAIQLGSGQAANDLATSLFQRKDHSLKTIRQAEALFELGAARSCTEASANLQIIRLATGQLSDQTE